jgi:hypothetical protein
MVRVALSVQGKIETKARLKIAILGILGLFIWAGLVIGPVIAVVASLLLYPQKNQT